MHMARARSVIPNRHRGGGKSHRHKAHALRRAKRMAVKADRRRGRAECVEQVEVTT